ncbi:VOC family protein, partial [Streptomyces sp. NPDC059618]
MNTLPARFDHIVLATPDLAATVAEFTRRTGVVPAPGGVHVGLGTRNHLVGL